ncbi:MAG: hypothetical protein OXQ29_27880 [Rhodospirillaceae bacterium]|nr:hypothetical protein [Rhodospirillaceae bacterium]
MLGTIERHARIGLTHLAAAVALSLTGASAVLADSGAAERWWNALNPVQMVAALYGEWGTETQVMAAMRMYADLDDGTRELVDAATAKIHGGGGFDSVGAWWESLDCRLMRVAAGDGIEADPASPFCAHYPGSGADRIMDKAATDWVNTVGQALLDRNDPGQFPE